MQENKNGKLLTFDRRAVDLLKEAINRGDVKEITRQYYRMNPQQAVQDGYKETPDEPPASAASEGQDAESASGAKSQQATATRSQDSSETLSLEMAKVGLVPEPSAPLDKAQEGSFTELLDKALDCAVRFGQGETSNKGKVEQYRAELLRRLRSQPMPQSSKEVMPTETTTERKPDSASATRATSEVTGVAAPIPSEPPTPAQSVKCTTCDGVGCCYAEGAARPCYECPICKGTGRNPGCKHVPAMTLREIMEAESPSPQPSEELLEQVTALSVYDHFREAHKSIAFIRHEFNLQGIESCAVDTVDSALYLAEFIIMARMQK